MLASQENTEKKGKIYKVWISLNEKSHELKGVLYETKDSAIMVSNSFQREDYAAGKFEVSKINYNDIDFVKIRAKNSVLNRALIGAVAGLAVGVLAGFIEGDDPPRSGLDMRPFSPHMTAERKATAYGIAFAFCGAGIGVLVGQINLKIPIKGDFEKFNRNKSKLKRHSFQ
jgi:hypothetical protein